MLNLNLVFKLLEDDFNNVFELLKNCRDFVFVFELKFHFAVLD